MGSRLALAFVLLAALACSPATTPSEPEGGGCIRIDGAYSMSYSEGGCGRSGAVSERVVVINQTGCAFDAVLPGYALLTGTITGNTLVFSLTLLVSTGGACGNAQLSGSGTVSAPTGGLTITGTYGTQAPAPAGCGCLPMPGQGSLTLRN